MVLVEGATSSAPEAAALARNAAGTAATPGKVTTTLSPVPITSTPPFAAWAPNSAAIVRTVARWSGCGRRMPPTWSCESQSRYRSDLGSERCFSSANSLSDAPLTCLTKSTARGAAAEAEAAAERAAKTWEEGGGAW